MVVYTHIKRLLDVLLSCTLLTILSPVFFAVMFAVNLEAKGNIFFKQRRMGQNGRPFTIYKFRTMHPDAPHNVASHDLPDAKRFISPIGRFLRITSLDELPQLLNVLKGDMSFVGPRPVILQETALLALRHEVGADRVRPGITGLAQICGRDHVCDLQKAAYDGVYARHCCFGLDLRILLCSVKYVLKREDVCL